jgi:ankyrin repeat protein
VIGNTNRKLLHIAADYGQLDVIELLLQKGATIDVSENILINAFSKNKFELRLHFTV